MFVTGKKRQCFKRDGLKFRDFAVPVMGNDAVRRFRPVSVGDFAENALGNLPTGRVHERLRRKPDAGLCEPRFLEGFPPQCVFRGFAGGDETARQGIPKTGVDALSEAAAPEPHAAIGREGNCRYTARRKSQKAKGAALQCESRQNARRGDDVESFAAPGRQVSLSAQAGHKAREPIVGRGVVVGEHQGYGVVAPRKSPGEFPGQFPKCRLGSR